MKRFDIRNYGACEGGNSLCTDAIQRAIGEAAGCGGEVVIPEGVYLSGAVFLKSGMSLCLEKGAVLLGTTDEAEYPLLESRVAGVEMKWPAALVNVRDARNVKICGEGTIDGQGEYWWNKYWGWDRKGGMRALYEKKGLRWAVDYDCFRVRNLAAFRAENLELCGFTSRRSGFWNIHLCYCKEAKINGLTIRDNDGPSTDGIDIDSCCNVAVENCSISCNDDNICLKSGRDADGLRVNRVCENVLIRNNRLFEGGGITLGSETSGGIRNVLITDNRFENTYAGFRMKSARTRGGTISGIEVRNLKMQNVKYPFSFLFDWNPSYSYCSIPEELRDEHPDYWEILAEKVPEEKGLPVAEDISIRNVQADVTEDGQESTAFDIQGLKESPFRSISFRDIAITADRFGVIANAEDVSLSNVKVSILAARKTEGSRKHET